jgi:hypothetical protein
MEELNRSRPGESSASSIASPPCRPLEGARRSRTAATEARIGAEQIEEG